MTYDRAPKRSADRRPAPVKSRDGYYPAFSDNRYKGLIYWWTFAELRADPAQVERYASRW